MARNDCVLDLLLFVLSLGVIVLACCLQLASSERVCVLGLPQLTLPHVCQSRVMFGVDCPGCGLTRSTILLVRGDLIGSFAQHRLGWLFGITIAFQIPYRLLRLARRALRLPGAVTRGWFYFLGLTLIANWVLKLTGI